MSRAPVKVTYRRGVIVGAAAAEQDDQFLSECFVDNGTADILSDTNRNESIILGRVGAGKSALIKHVEDSERTLRIDPQEFSMNYIENSSAIQLLNELGVSLDVLFQALWKHVLTVEVLRLKYKESNIRESIEKFFAPRNKKESNAEALDYFREFGGSDFWTTTELRIKEIISRAEQSVESEMGGKAATILAKLRSANKLSEQERREYRDKAQKAVSAVQIQKLHKVVDALGDVLEDQQKSLSKP